MSEKEDPRLKQFKTEFARQAASLALTSIEVAKENEKLVARLAEARRVLKKLEWLDGTDGYQRCPECSGIDPSHGMKVCGHTPDCALAKALGEGG